MSVGLIEELTARGFAAQQSAPSAELESFLAEKPRTVYAGFDPTADSLHVGNLIPIIGLRHFQRAGHRAIAVIGGGTGMIGDPSGKDSERSLLDNETLAANVEGQRRQLERLLDASGGVTAAKVVDNIEWLASFSLIDFLRDVGKHFRIGEMLARESVRRRLEGEGLSFTEFSYQLLQAYDFYHLFRHEDCELQIGGSDQWGNILGGTELIRKLSGADAHAVTFPLITTATGEKFGKSAGNAVWLDPAQSSPYQFYQYFIRTDDRDVERYLHYFTFLPLEEIAALAAQHAAAPERRDGQRKLAEEITRFVHGEQELAKVQRATQILFGGEISGLSDRELGEIFADVPSTTMLRDALAAGPPLAELLASTGLCPSKGAARKMIQSGGAYVNNQRAADPRQAVTTADLASEHVLVLRTGKKNYHLIRIDE
ncbi:tyrosine--tRNA ligase [Candidatus Sumerlaeota bacterium]